MSRPFSIRKYSVRFAGRGGSVAQQTDPAPEERSQKSVRMSLHLCRPRQIRRTHLPREQWSVSITGMGHAIEAGALSAV